MNVEALGAVGDFVGGLGVIASLLYLAFQIRQNTRAVRSASYHQAAEQLWNWCLSVAGKGELAEILAKRAAGGSLTPVEQTRGGSADQALLFGFENMLRLREEGLVDRDVWRNFIANSMVFLGTPYCRALLATRAGPLSARLLAVIEEYDRSGVQGVR